MHEGEIAEFILSLVVTPERAAAAIGDLEEERPLRGRVWFWWSVLVTAVAQAGEGLRTDPQWAIGRGVWGVNA